MPFKEIIAVYTNNAKIKILWHIFSKQELWSRESPPLLGNGSVNTFIARQGEPQHILPAATKEHATIEELLEAVCSVLSVPRLYNESAVQFSPGANS
jgi:hypothetical protein